MPTYEYACRACGEHVEVVQSFKDDPLTACGICGGDLRKVFSAAGIIFKGSGYYVTDTRKERKQGAAAESGSGTDKAASDGSSKSDGASKDAQQSTSAPAAESA